MNNSLKKLRVFFIFFGPWAKRFQRFCEKISTGLSKLVSRSPWGNFFDGNLFFQKFVGFYSNLHIEQQKSAFFLKNVPGLSKLHFTSTYENRPEKHFVLKVSEPISIIERKSYALSQKLFRRCCQNFIALQAFIFPQKLYSFVSGMDFEQKHIGFLSKIFHWVCQKGILLRHRN